MADKVYEPEVIQDAPFPGEPVIVGTQSQSSSGDIYSPTTTKEKPFKKKVIASETIASSLNTRSRKILEAFDLEQRGAIQVGNFQSGVSGDLRITPNGLTARDQAGITTFAIDGTTGNATFKGTVEAADFTVIDGSGLISLSNFDSNTALKTTEQNISTNDVYVDITGLTHTINLDRPTNVLFFGVIDVRLSGNQADPIIRINYGGSYFPSAEGWYAMGKYPNDVPHYGASFSFSQLLLLPAGKTVVKLEGKTSTTDATFSIGFQSLNTSSFGYVTLGR